MEKKIRYHYTDIKTGKLHYTCGPFGGWYGPAGLLNVYYAVFFLRESELLIPEYLLTQETRKMLPPRERDEKEKKEEEGGQDELHSTRG